MKLIYKNKVLISALILAFFSIIGFSLYQNRKLGFSSKILKKVETLPKSYQECDKKNPKKENFNPADYIFPICDYFVEESSPLFQECMTYGGIKTEKICALCLGCDCIPAGCKLTYIDPNFVLPINYNECRKIFTHSEGSNIYENENKKYCSILLPKQGIFNVDVGKRVYKDCLSQNGKMFGDNESCELKFYKD